MIKGKLRPLADRVIVEPAEAADMTESGLHVPDIAKEKPQEGVVVAVGPGALLDIARTCKFVATSGAARKPMELKVGERVLYGKYSGTEVEVEGKPLLILRESDVLAVAEEGE